jgi:hypothetical protein
LNQFNSFQDVQALRNEKIVATSSMEAELIALNTAVKEVLWLVRAIGKSGKHYRRGVRG